MKMIPIIIVLGMMLMVVPMIRAEESTQQYNKIFLDPFYRESLEPDTPYDYTVTIEPPDKISSVTSAIVSFSVWHNPTIRYDLKVNGEYCLNPTFLVHTSYENAGNNEIFFDCSNVIHKAGTYTLTLTPDDDTGTITGWIDLTYSNKPKGNIEIFGTEYQVGDDTTTFIQLIDNDEVTPINDATCFVTYFYPDNSIWLSNQLMTYQSGSNGLYYYDSTAQSQTGVYMVDVYCEYETELYYYNASGITIINGTYVDGTNFSVQESDDDRYVIKETGTELIGYEIVSYWKMDETNGTIMYESSSIGNNAQYNNNPNQTVIGTQNTGTYFDGTDDYVNLTKVSAYDLNASEDMAICFGINSTDVQGDNRLFDFYWNTGGFRIEGDDDELIFELVRAGSSYTIKTATQFNDGLWHDVCFISDMDASNLYAYVDGVLDKTQGRTMSGISTFPPYIHIGASDAVPIGEYYEGGLDEICLLKGTDINITELVSNYNESSCGGELTPIDNRTINADVTISNVTLVNATLNSFTILTEYQWLDSNGSDDINVYVYNVSGSDWVLLNNKLTYAISDTIISSTLSANISDFLDGSNNMIVKYNDTIIEESGLDIFRIDQVQLIQEYFISTPIQEIRGGGELHVEEYNFSKLNTIPEDVWNYDGTISNDILDQLVSAFWNYTLVINPNILNQFADAFWSSPNATDFNITVNNTINITVNETIINSTEIAEEVWDSPIRNLTQTEDNFNYSALLTAEDFWNYTDKTTNTESLWVGGTEYSPDEDTGKVVVRIIQDDKTPVTGANCTLYIVYPNNTLYLTQQMTEATGGSFDAVYYVDFNQSGEVGVHPYAVDCSGGGKNYFMMDTYHVYGANYTRQAEAIWEYTPDRNLTYYETANVSNLTVNVNASEIADEVWNYQGTISDNILNQFGLKTLCFLEQLFNRAEDKGWGIDIPIC